MDMRRTWAALAVGVVLAAGSSTSAVAADPHGSRPVTRPDTATVKVGQSLEIDPLANDSDPDGDELTICRLGEEPAGLDAYNFDDSIMVNPERAGTFTLDYYACDYDYLTKGTITITVTPAGVLHLRVRKMHQPGKVRLVNRSTFRVSFAWGSVTADKADGSRWLEPGQRAVIRVRRHSIVWVAAQPDESVYVVRALRGIRLPAGTKALPPGAPKGKHIPSTFGSGSEDDRLVAPRWGA